MLGCCALRAFEIGAFPRRLVSQVALFALAWAISPSLLPAAELADVQKLLHAGKYEACLAATKSAIDEGAWDDTWWHMRIESFLALGQYPQALKALDDALDKHPTSLRLRVLGRQVCLHNADKQRAEKQRATEKLVGEIEALANNTPWRYSDAANRVALGKTFLLKGGDARQVLELFYDPAKRSRPEYAETYLAMGELALAKYDDALAAEAFGQAVKHSPDDPAGHFGLARAYESGDSAKSAKALEAALRLNPRHTPSLLMQAEELIDAERYDAALAKLDEVFAVNRWDSQAWSLRAVMAHLEGDSRGEQLFRAAALRWWPDNPAVPHTIGRKLSQKYRFAEGAEYQRQALVFDPSFLPAQTQLCQDLLRLGEETPGWRLAHERLQPRRVQRRGLQLGDPARQPGQVSRVGSRRLHRADASR